MGKYGTNYDGFGAFEGGVNADKGAPLLSTNSDGATSLLMGAPLIREIQAGVANGDFAITPDDASSTITSTNPLPYWTFTDVNSVGAITCAIVADSSNASGNVLRWSVAGGTTTGKSATLTRYIQIPGSRNREFVFNPEMTMVNATASTAIYATIGLTWYKSDGVSVAAPGITSSTSNTFTVIASSNPTIPAASDPSVNTSPASDAAFMLITITIATSGTVSAGTKTVDLAEVRIASGQSDVYVAENGSASAYPPSRMRQSSGALTIQTPGTGGPVSGKLILNTPKLVITDPALITNDNANSPEILMSGASITLKQGSASGDIIFKTSAGVTIFTINNASNLVLETTGGYRQTTPPTTTQTTSQAIWFNTAGTTWELRRNSSSNRYKTDITDADATVLEAAKKIKPRHYRSTIESEDSATRLGFIAEEIDAAGLTHAVGYDSDGRPETIDPTALIAALYHRVNELEERLAALES